MTVDTEHLTLAQLRAQLAEAQIALRTHKDLLDVAETTCEQRTIDGAGDPKALGANETERKRKLTIALAEDQGVAHWRHQVREQEATIDRLQAELSTQLDARRLSEWAIRERTLQLLEARLASNGLDEATDEHIDDLTEPVPSNEGGFALPF